MRARQGTRQVTCHILATHSYAVGLRGRQWSVAHRATQACLLTLKTALSMSIPLPSTLVGLHARTTPVALPERRPLTNGHCHRLLRACSADWGPDTHRLAWPLQGGVDPFYR